MNIAFHGHCRFHDHCLHFARFHNCGLILTAIHAFFTAIRAFFTAMSRIFTAIRSLLRFNSQPSPFFRGHLPNRPATPGHIAKSGWSLRTCFLWFFRARASRKTSRVLRRGPYTDSQMVRVTQRRPNLTRLGGARTSNHFGLDSVNEFGARKLFAFVHRMCGQAPRRPEKLQSFQFRKDDLCRIRHG